MTTKPKLFSVLPLLAAASLLPALVGSDEAFAEDIDIIFLSDFEHKGIFEYAVDAFNAEQKSLGTGYQIVSETIDTAAGGSDVKEKIASAYNNGDGTKYFIGPLASSTSTVAKAFADTTDDIVLLSPSSTAASLAIPDDSLFRLVPNDFAQAPEIARHVASQGAENIVVLYRNDPWGSGLLDGLKRSDDVTIVREISLVPTGMDTYDNAANTAAYLSAARTAANQINALVSTYGTDAVAVVLLSFDWDAVAIANAITSDVDLHNTLSDVRWYGADGTAGQSELSDDANVYAFYSSVQFESSIYAAPPNALNQRLAALTFDDDASFRNNMYDAVFLLADAIIVQQESNSDATVRSLLIDVAAGTLTHDNHAADRVIGAGALGDYALNSDGEMAHTLATYVWIPVAPHQPPHTTCR